jgi:hypothetical protein
MIHETHIESCRLVSSDPCGARPLHQDRKWFLLAVSIAGRILFPPCALWISSPFSNVLMTCVTTLKFARFALRSPWLGASTSQNIGAAHNGGLNISGPFVQTNAVIFISFKLLCRTKHGKAPIECCARVCVAAAKHPTTDIDFSIALRVIFGDINYYARAKRCALAQRPMVTKRRKPETKLRFVRWGDGDTIIDKESSHRIELVPRQYSWNARGLVKGIGMVNGVYANPLTQESGSSITAFTILAAPARQYDIACATR